MNLNDFEKTDYSGLYISKDTHPEFGKKYIVRFQYDKKRYVFKSSVLNSLWCRPSMDIFDLTIPVKLSDFVVTDLGNGVSKYEFT